MKKLTLLVFAAMAAVSSYSSTVLWDGESYELGTQGGLWADGSPTVVANLEQSGINTSAKCISFTMTSSSKVIKVPFRDWITPNLNGNRRVSMMIKKTTNENVEIQLSDPTNGADGYWQSVAAWYGGSGAWQKVVFDFSTNSINDYPGVMTITAQTSSVSSDEQVYIDNIVVEDVPLVNGAAISSFADGSLTGAITLTGSWMQGTCSNTSNSWSSVNYNDFSSLSAKLSAGVTSVEMRGAVLKDAYNVFGDINPNCLVYADNTFGDNNVIAGGAVSNLVLDESKAFNCPEGFTASNVVITRALASGWNTLCLPFETTATELGASKIATYNSYTSGENASVKFTTAESVAANIPFIASMAGTSTSQTFANKSIVATSASLSSGEFVGVYAPASAAGLWGLNNNQFIKGGTEATVNAFHAYLSLPSEVKSVSFDGTTGVNSIVADNENVDVYAINGCRMRSNVQMSDATSGLSKGIYIINNKKVVVK